MIRKISQLGSDIGIWDIAKGAMSIFNNQMRKFTVELSRYQSREFVYLVSSGTAAFSIILNALMKGSSKREVIIPAYTAPVVVLPILKAGLKPVLCDISLEDFNMDIENIHKIVSEKTLCVVPTYMFGIGVNGIESLKNKIGDTFVVEDCAQSMGSKIGGLPLGSFSDVAFTSFNRGKNLPTYGGGCVFTNSAKLAEAIDRDITKLKGQGIMRELILPFKLAAFALALRPLAFGALYPIVSRFKDNKVAENFTSLKYTVCQAGVGLSLLKRMEEACESRFKNGKKLIDGLQGIKGIIVPDAARGTRYAFNRLPIVIKDIAVKAKIEEEMKKIGVDTSVMYGRPIHHIFDLGYKHEDFHNSCYVASRILTLPTHQLVCDKDIGMILGVIRGVFTK